LKKNVATKAPSAFVKMRNERKEVSITKANNGFIVRGCVGGYENEKTFIAKDEKEARTLASKLL
jgi:AMMECR1 domain-containing protein